MVSLECVIPKKIQGWHELQLVLNYEKSKPRRSTDVIKGFPPFWLVVLRIGLPKMISAYSALNKASSISIKTVRLKYIVTIKFASVPRLRNRCQGVCYSTCEGVRSLFREYLGTTRMRLILLRFFLHNTEMHSAVDIAAIEETAAAFRRFE